MTSAATAPRSGARLGAVIIRVCVACPYLRTCRGRVVDPNGHDHARAKGVGVRGGVRTPPDDAWPLRKADLRPAQDVASRPPTPYSSKGGVRGPPVQRQGDDDEETTKEAELARTPPKTPTFFQQKSPQNWGFQVNIF